MLHTVDKSNFILRKHACSVIENVNVKDIDSTQKNIQNKTLIIDYLKNSKLQG